MAGRGGGATSQQQQQQQHDVGIIGQASRASTPAPPHPSDGEFLLQLLRKSTTSSSSASASSTASHDHQLVDPAIAALGPSHPFTPYPNNTPSAAVPVPPDIHNHLLPISEFGSPSPSWTNNHNHQTSLNHTGFFDGPVWNPSLFSRRIDGFDPGSSHLQGSSLQVPCDFGRKQQDGNGLFTKREESTSHRWPLTFGPIACDLRNQDGVSNGNCTADSPNLFEIKSTLDSIPCFPRGSEQTRDNLRNRFHYEHQGRGESRDRIGKMDSNVKQHGPCQASVQDDVLNSHKEWDMPPGPCQKLCLGKGVEQWNERNRDEEDDAPIKWNRTSFPLYGDNTGEEEMLPKKLLDIEAPSGPRSHPGDNVLSTVPLFDQLDHSGPHRGSNLHSAAALDMDQSFTSFHGVAGEKSWRGARRPDRENGSRGSIYGNGIRERDILAKERIGSFNLRDELVNKNAGSHYYNSRGKDLNKGLHPPGQLLRNRRREMECRHDLDRHTPYFLSIYESLLPTEDENAKRESLLGSLQILISKEWPGSQLRLYGSCANSFGVSNSDVDICLEIDVDDLSKSEILLRLADILLSGKLENVKALTHARVPVVKLMDPRTGISCDICINNALAVVNTKLLRDYARIDVRLRQLAFMVKHWAKSRRVNETYRGTLSSYAYVLMCIHFLQQRKPAILPCLQEMEATYVVAVDEIECAYFDQVEKLCDFGVQNKETVGQLLWAFFQYWAYRHDYANSVISVRTGSFISKTAKDWTRRIGNDRHLICIEDPFETSHDLGRVVDKYSIKTLREEFKRAADILSYDPNPSVMLFEPYLLT